MRSELGTCRPQTSCCSVMRFQFLSVYEPQGGVSQVTQLHLLENHDMVWVGYTQAVDELPSFFSVV